MKPKQERNFLTQMQSFQLMTACSTEEWKKNLLQRSDEDNAVELTKALGFPLSACNVRGARMSLEYRKHGPKVEKPVKIKAKDLAAAMEIVAEQQVEINKLQTNMQGVLQRVTALEKSQLPNNRL